MLLQTKPDFSRVCKIFYLVKYLMLLKTQPLDFHLQNLLLSNPHILTDALPIQHVITDD